jgi:serpin B
VLPAMGMADAFSSASADFTGITAQKPFCLGAVLHKAFVAVDEKGTEAAAATAVMVYATSARAPDPTPVFRADHPFFFVIRDNGTGSLLFAGRLVNPQAK